MNSARNSHKRRSNQRDGSRFLALPHCVIESEAYRRLSHPAKCLLIDIAIQLAGDNNGRLLASFAHLRQRGWNSADVISRAKAALLREGFIHETVKGCRPNKASWYAVTWVNLDKHNGYDYGAEASFVRSAYAKAASLSPKPTRQDLYGKWQDAGKTAHPLDCLPVQKPLQ
jgi:hypothetical protein